MLIRNNRRTYIIFALCAVLVLMAVAYAAFHQRLTINGAASTTNGWCLGFDTTKTSTYTTTTGLTGATAPTGSMTYSGNVCQTNYKPSATLTSVLHQPGDIIEYTLTIKNASSVGAAIKSILIDNQSVTSDTEITKGNIVYTITMPSTTTLSANAETTMKVKAKFQDATDIVGQYTGENNTLTISINSEQDDGSGGFTPVPSSFTGTIYRWSTTYLANKGTSPASSYPYTITNLTKGTDYITEADYPTASARAAALNHQYYLKHDIVNDEIIDSHVCFISDTEHCMKGGSGTIFSDNTQIVQGYQTYYNLSEVSSPSSSNPGCKYTSTELNCYGGGLWRLYVFKPTYAIAYGSSDSYCTADGRGMSRCFGT